MSRLAQFQAQAAALAETGPDMNEKTAGGGGRLLPAGYAFARLVEYIELGSQPQEYQGQKKDPKPEFRLGFALWGEPEPGNKYHNDDGTPYVIRTFDMTLDRNEKAKAFKLFKLMNWRGTAKNFAQMLGWGFLLKIVHEPKDKAQPNGQKVSRIDLAGFLPPLDPVTKAPYPIPEAADELYQCFIWDAPTKEAWDALYVEGKYDDGKSKNRVQETILGAVDFQGSPLQMLLMGNAITGATVGQAAPATPSVPVGGVTAPNVTVPALPAVGGASPAPFVPPAVPSALPGSTGTSESPSAPAATTATTSPSSPAIPALPAIPAIPAIPAVPQ